MNAPSERMITGRVTELRKVTDDGCDLLLEWESGESFRVRAPHLDYHREVAYGTVGSTVIARGHRARPPYDLIADTVERMAS